jgi:two-component system, chemotaxis family, CheB/CheR fusion protein
VSDEEVHIERPDGSRITVVVSIRPLKSERGEITGAINCFYDITERKQAEQNLSEAARRFRFLAESMPQKIFTAKPNGELDYLNQQWVEYTGLVFEQIKECGWKTFIHPEDLPENLRTWQHSIDSGEPFRFEHRFRRADGNYRWHLSRAVAMRDSNGNIRMWIGSNTDIQDVREQEDRLRKIEKMAAAGQLASSIAHEVNNPLSSVTNSLYLLENHANLDESARFYVSIASTELARVSRIVKQSLSYYRAGTVPGDVDLDAIVNESLNIFSEKLKRTGIELKPKVDSGAALVGFPDELRQVVDNLLLNALEAMPGGGRLSISVHESYDWTRNDHKHRKGVRLTIADTGCGIPKDILAQVFEPFFTTKTEKGTGLGLWILQGIISKHEGIMSLRSSDVKGKSGTVISIFFPSPTGASRTSKFSEAESAA